jgi:hypothetical protein
VGRKAALLLLSSAEGLADEFLAFASHAGGILRWTRVPQGSREMAKKCALCALSCRAGGFFCVSLSS